LIRERLFEVKAKKLFRKEKVINALKAIGNLRFRVSHSSILHFSTLILILFIAFMVRLLPIRWGFYLSEFDPHIQYLEAKYMVDHGFFAWSSWHNYMAWYPNGRSMGTTTYPGLAAAAAFSYIILRPLGLSIAPMFTSNPLTTDPLYNLCVIFPVIAGTFACLAIYLLGRDIGGKEVGLFAALFLALNSSYISRSNLGFFDDESIAIPALILFIFFFLRSIEPERSLRNGLSYAVAAGLSLGYMLVTWGAGRYPLGMAVLFVFVLLLLRRYSSRLLLSYSATFGIALFIAVNIPRLGFGFLTETEVLAIFGILLLLCVFEVFPYIKTLKMKTVFVFASLAFIAVFFLTLSLLAYASPLAFKWVAVIDPFSRFGGGTSLAFLQSVAEERPAAWGSFYVDLGIGAFFVPVGLFFAVQKPTNRNIFLCIFGLTSIYFASSMVRLTLLMAPAMCLLWALGLVQLLRPFILVMKEVPAIPGRKTLLKAHVGKEFSGAFILMILLLMTYTFVMPSPGATFPWALDHAYSPTTIAAASLPVRPNQPITDWLDALNWMRVNLKSTDVVAAWWDYGYWITIIANKTSLDDNGTIDLTKIGRVGVMFLSNETNAIEILKGYNATYVVVFTTFTGNGTDVGWGDEGKWRWMARIGGLNESDYGSYSSTTGSWQWNAKGQGTVIYKMMQYGKQVTLGQTPTVQFLSNENGKPFFEEAYFSQIAGSPKSYGGVVPLVCVYKINYV
jgi:dolichyl-diphosphooligosaccharide--protein glycosyltransferase